MCLMPAEIKKEKVELLQSLYLFPFLKSIDHSFDLSIIPGPLQ